MLLLTILAPLFALSFFILNGLSEVYWILSWLLILWFEKLWGVGIIPAVIRPWTGPAKGLGAANGSWATGASLDACWEGFVILRRFSETLLFYSPPGVFEPGGVKGLFPFWGESTVFFWIVDSLIFSSCDGYLTLLY